MKHRPIAPHPGEILNDYLAALPVSAAAEAIGVSRSTLSRILSGKSRISSEVAVRLSDALGTSATLWKDLQRQFDLRSDGSLAVRKVQKRTRPVAPSLPLTSKGVLVPPPGWKRGGTDSQIEFAKEMTAWEAIAAVGREFGSPDYDRLAELDELAWKALGSMLKARRWLDTPHSDLGGLAPEAAAKTRTGHQRVLRLLRRILNGKK